jgi:hypothetical protein
MRAYESVPEFMVFKWWIGIVIMTFILVCFLFATAKSVYVTYDPEGDYLIWDSKPELKDGIWMPTKKDFHVESISEKAAAILCKELPSQEQYVKLIY